MEILYRGFGVARSTSVLHIIFCLIGIIGTFQLVHARHRDVDDVQYQNAGLKYDSQLSSAEHTADDGMYFHNKKIIYSSQFFFEFLLFFLFFEFNLIFFRL